MSNETDHFSKTLVFTLNVILDSDAEKRQSIASAYQEAGLLVATIPLDKDGARLLAMLPAPDGFSGLRRKGSMNEICRDGDSCIR